METVTRKAFVQGLGGAMAVECAAASPWPLDTDDLDVWQRETDAVTPGPAEEVFDRLTAEYGV